MTTEAEECPHGLDPAWCSTCKHGPAKRPTVTWGTTFPSRYDNGDCVVCHGSIYLDDPIACRFMDGDRTGYAHTECVP